MEAEKLQDAFVFKQTASQEPEFPSSPPSREFEIFLDSNNEQLSSSPDLLQSEATGIVVISLPDSSCSVDQHTLEKEDAVFVTAPEHNQNVLQLCVAEATDAMEARVSEVGLDDEPEMEPGEEPDGCIVPFGETEVAAETDGGEGEIIVLDTGADEIMATSNLDAADEAATVSIVRLISGLLSNYVAVDGKNETLDGGEIAKLKRIAGKSCLKVKLRVRGYDKAFKPPKAAKKRKESHSSGSVRSGRNRVEEIDEFRYDATFEGRTGRQAGSKRPSSEGKGKEVVKTLENRSGLLDLADKLKIVFGGMDGGCDCDEDVDFLETAKKKGMTFPRPRWWPDGDEEGYPS